MERIVAALTRTVRDAETAEQALFAYMIKLAKLEAKRQLAVIDDE